MSKLLCDLTDYGLLKVSGPDAKKLLQGQVTCDVDKITASYTSMGAHCNPQGRVLSLFYLFWLQDAYYLLMPRNMVPVATLALKKYAVFYKVTLTDASEHFLTLGYSGSELHDVNNANTAIIKLPTASPRYLICGVLPELKAQWEVLANTARVIDANAWQCLNIQAGIPAIYPQTSGRFLPHDLQLPALGAVSFDKGCFTGQEIIARMQYRGKPKNHLYTASILSDFTPLPGADLYSGKGEEKRPCASIVDACLEEYNKYNVLLVTDDANAKPNHLFQDGDDQVFFTFLNNNMRK